MTQSNIEYHLKMLADSVQMLSCMVGVPDYKDAADSKEAQKWFQDKLELIFLRCKAVLEEK